MKTVTAADANRQFSRLLRDVEGRQEVTITFHGRAGRRMVPAGERTSEERDAAKAHPASAAEAGCRLLLSEDMHDGFIWAGVTVANSFLDRRQPVLENILKSTS